MKFCPPQSRPGPNQMSRLIWDKFLFCLVPHNGRYKFKQQNVDIHMSHEGGGGGSYSEIIILCVRKAIPHKQIRSHHS